MIRHQPWQYWQIVRKSNPNMPTLITAITELNGLGKSKSVINVLWKCALHVVSCTYYTMHARMHASMSCTAHHGYDLHMYMRAHIPWLRAHPLNTNKMYTWLISKPTWRAPLGTTALHVPGCLPQIVRTSFSGSVRAWQPSDERTSLGSPQTWSLLPTPCLRATDNNAREQVLEHNACVWTDGYCTCATSQLSAFHILKTAPFFLQRSPLPSPTAPPRIFHSFGGASNF